MADADADAVAGGDGPSTSTPLPGGATTFGSLPSSPLNGRTRVANGPGPSTPTRTGSSDIAVVQRRRLRSLSPSSEAVAVAAAVASVARISSSHPDSHVKSSNLHNSGPAPSSPRGRLGRREGVMAIGLKKSRLTSPSSVRSTPQPAGNSRMSSPSLSHRSAFVQMETVARTSIEQPESVAEGEGKEDADKQPPATTTRIFYNDGRGHEGELDLEHDVCAMAINVFADVGRSEVEGEVLIVPKAKSLSRDEWISWVHMLLLNLSMVAFLAKLFGPITAVVIVASTIMMRDEIDGHLVKEFQLAPENLHDCKAAMGLSAFVANAVMLAGSWTTALGVSAVLCVLAAIARDIFVLPTGFRYIAPTRPIVVSYPESEIPALLAFRREGRNNPLARSKLEHLAVGSYWAEMVLSVLLYHDVYNSLKLRRAARFFLVFALPIIFAFQVMYTLSPRFLLFLAHVQQSVGADYGVRFVRSLAHMLKASDILPGPPAFLLQAADGMRRTLGLLTLWTSYVSAWVVPVDEAITYIRVKFEPLNKVFWHIVRALAPLGHMLQLMTQSVFMLLLPMARKGGAAMKAVTRLIGEMRKVVAITATRPVHEVVELHDAALRTVRGDFSFSWWRRRQNDNDANVSTDSTTGGERSQTSEYSQLSPHSSERQDTPQHNWIYAAAAPPRTMRCASPDFPPQRVAVQRSLSSPVFGERQRSASEPDLSRVMLPPPSE